MIEGGWVDDQRIVAGQHAGIVTRTSSGPAITDRGYDAASTSAAAPDPA